jgi:predicted tellurium resistance membrane protein TerC
MIVRIILLLAITWVITFVEPLFFLSDIIGHDFTERFLEHDHPFSGRDLILMFGGLFLIAKSTSEMNHEVEDDEDETDEAKIKAKATNSFTKVIMQIILLDIIFSFDSILTAVGLTSERLIMIFAVVISIAIMMLFSGKISDYIHKHPSLEVLALGFLILIGFMLFLEGLEYDIPKGYIYFAVVFSLLIEMFNIRVRNKRQRIKAEKAAEKAEKKAREAAQNATA